MRARRWRGAWKFLDCEAAMFLFCPRCNTFSLYDPAFVLTETTTVVFCNACQARFLVDIHFAPLELDESKLPLDNGIYWGEGTGT
jgi:transcription elongation factor Elf1